MSTGISSSMVSKPRNDGLVLFCAEYFNVEKLYDLKCKVMASRGLILR